MSDLDRLIEAVETGLPSPTNWRNFAAVPAIDDDNSGPVLAHRAYHGSLDAAKALHRALLPGWEWRGIDDGRWWVWRTPSDIQEAEADIPARAWLLAILRAYRDSNQAEGAR